MLSIAATKPLGWGYYTRRTRTGYYLRRTRSSGDDDGASPDDPGFDPNSIWIPGEPDGIWMGTGAEMLGLRGKLTEAPLQYLMRGYLPGTHTPLVQNAGDRKRRPSWDLTYSCPKDVSGLWGISPELRDPIYDSFIESIRWVIALTEERFLYIRKGKAPHLTPIRCRIPAAVFPNSTSKALDPDLHGHGLHINVGITDDHQSGTLHSPVLYYHKKLLGALQRAKHAYYLRTGLGLSLEPDGSGSYRVKGFPEELRQFWSKRRKQIEEVCARKGIKTGGREAAIVAYDTRSGKDEVLPQGELFKRWTEEALQESNFTPEKALELQEWTEFNEAANRKKLLRLALRDCITLRSTFTEYDFALCAAQLLPAFPFDPDTLLDSITEFLDSDRVIALGRDEKLFMRYTTKESLAAEKKLLRNVKKLNKSRGIRISNSVLRQVFRTHPHLADEQQSAVRNFVQADSSIRSLQAPAGSGKTSHVADVAIEALKRAGYDCIGLAPTNKATNKLRDETGLPCFTVARFLGDYKLPLKARLKRGLLTPNPSVTLPDDSRLARFHHRVDHVVMEFKRQKPRRRRRRKRRQQPTGPRKIIEANRHTVLFVDEGSMIGLRHWTKLTKLAVNNGATLALIGDRGQIRPVGDRPAFESIQNRSSLATLSKIYRQQRAYARQASEELTIGDAEKAIAKYVATGCVHVFEEIEEGVSSLIKEWAKYGILEPERCALILPTHDQVEQANDLAQKSRLDAGILDARKSAKIVSIEESGQERHTFRATVHPGDLIRLTRGFDDKISKNERARVVDIENGKPLVCSERGVSVTIPHDFKGIRRGYAGTVHSHQGDTFPLFVGTLLGGGMQDAELTLVELTRHKTNISIHVSSALLRKTDDRVYGIDELEDLVRNSGLFPQITDKPENRLAHDFLELREQKRDKGAEQAKNDHRQKTRARTRRLRDRLSELDATLDAIENRRLAATNDKETQHSPGDAETACASGLNEQDEPSRTPILPQKQQGTRRKEPVRRRAFQLQHQPVAERTGDSDIPKSLFGDRPLIRLFESWDKQWKSALAERKALEQRVRDNEEQRRRCRANLPQRKVSVLARTLQALDAAHIKNLEDLQRQWRACEEELEQELKTRRQDAEQITKLKDEERRKREEREREQRRQAEAAHKQQQKRRRWIEEVERKREEDMRRWSEEEERRKQQAKEYREHQRHQRELERKEVERKRREHLAAIERAKTHWNQWRMTPEAFQFWEWITKYNKAVGRYNDTYAFRAKYRYYQRRIQLDFETWFENCFEKCGIQKGLIDRIVAYNDDVEWCNYENDVARERACQIAEERRRQGDQAAMSVNLSCPIVPTGSAAYGACQPTSTSNYVSNYYSPDSSPTQAGYNQTDYDIAGGAAAMWEARMSQVNNSNPPSPVTPVQTTSSQTIQPWATVQRVET